MCAATDNAVDVAKVLVEYNLENNQSMRRRRL